MAKDPAFLFYVSDFLGGTMFLSNEQVGKYIRALCAQHQTGRLTADQLNSITGNDPTINKKFLQDPEGSWYNARLGKRNRKEEAIFS